MMTPEEHLKIAMYHVEKASETEHITAAGKVSLLESHAKMRGIKSGVSMNRSDSNGIDSDE